MQFLRDLLGLKTAGIESHRTIGDVRVTLQSDIRQVHDDFIALYPPARETTGDSHPPIELEVSRSGRSSTGRPLYRVTADGHELGGRYPRSGVFPLLEWGINLRLIATRGEFVQIHAASMVHRGQGFIFAGDSGCGKSTLAATLLARGWQYLCDEFALIDPHNLTLKPFPKALCIKAGSYPAIRKLGIPFARRRDYVKAFKGRVGYINAREIGADRIGQPSPACFVVFPRFQEGAEAKLTPIPRADAATLLYRCCFNKGALPQSALPTLAALVKQAECYRLVVGNSAETVRLLEILCEKSPKRLWVDDGLRAAEQPRSLRRMDRTATRREVLKVGAKLAYVAPVVLTLTSGQAFAAASNPSGYCSTGTHTGQLCETDMDCCSRQCNLGVCQ